MSSGIAQRRAAKAARRKKLLAERRKLALAQAKASLAQEVRRLAKGPLDSCLVQEGLFEHGNGIVILTRESTSGRLAFASFLVDVFCLGVKDVAFRQCDESKVDEFIDMIEEAAPLEQVDPCYARKLLRDVVAWSRTLGIEPQADYAAVELMFGDSLADSCETSFAFGQDGKPVHIPGPADTPARVRRHIEQLRARLGDDGFEIVLLEEEEDDDDFAAEDDGAEGYDPDHAPDPVEWLALDEDERLIRIEDYHLREGIELPNHRVHASFHLVVENQIALGDELPVRRVVARLMEEGMDRHEALHAVCTVLAVHLHEIMQGGAARPISHAAYNEAVEKLTAEGWRREWGAENEGDRL